MAAGACVGIALAAWLKPAKRLTGMVHPLWHVSLAMAGCAEQSESGGE